MRAEARNRAAGITDSRLPSLPLASRFVGNAAQRTRALGLCYAMTAVMTLDPPAAGSLAEESPGDAYDQLLAARRGQARGSITRCLKWWAAGHAAVAAAFGLLIGAIAVALAHRAAGDSAVLFLVVSAGVVGLPGLFFCVVPAGRAAYVTFRDRSVLPPRWTVAGLVPWLVLSGEVFVFMFGDYIF